MAEVSIRGRKLTYNAQPVDFDKSALTVVFIHGSGGDKDDWQEQLSGVSDTANVMAIDLPGHGDSEPPGERNVAIYAQWVSDLVEEIGLEKALLVGCSLGSAIAQWLALEGKPWLAGIGLVGAGARLKVHPAFLEGFLNDKTAAIGMLVEYALSPATVDPVRSRVREKLDQGPVEVLHGDFSACNEFDVTDRISKIKLPTWILVGEDDRLTPVKYARFLNDAIQGSKLDIVPAAGHLAMVEKPEEFNRLLKDFLKTL
jgi:pimeloyl-ACP methyl ester carboxylesterase